MSTDTNYSYLLDEYEKDYILNWALYWHRTAKKVIEEAGLTGKATVNTLRIANMVCSYFADIIRLKQFHPIERVNTIKIFAYGAFWFLRNNPVQLIDDVTDEQLYINEKVAAQVLMSEFFHDIQTPNDQDAHLALAKELMYMFKYRYFSPQVIELVICSYLIGAKKITIVDGKYKLETNDTYNN